MDYGLLDKDIIKYIDKSDFTSLFNINDDDNKDIKINLKKMLNNDEFERAMNNIYVPILSSLPPPPYINETKKTSSTNEVFLNNVFENQTTVVKKINLNEVYEYDEEFGREKIIKIKEIIFEVIINLIFYEITVNELMVCPKPFKLYKDTNSLYYFQQQVNGKELHTLNEKDMLDSLFIICQSLKELQQDFYFSHRDFKSDNVLYDIESKKVYVIDFGFACISGLSCSKSIQSDENSAGDISTTPSLAACTNRSADICFLILSIYANMGQQNKPDFIEALANDIAKEYGGYDQNIIYDNFQKEAAQFTPDRILQRLYTYQSDDDYSSSSSDSSDSSSSDDDYPSEVEQRKISR